MKRFYFFLLKTDHFSSLTAFLKEQKLKGKFSDNLGQNIYRFFHVLVQFLFTISETELDYYHQTVNVRVTSSVKRLMLVFDGPYSAGHPKAKFWRFSEKNREISAVKHFIEKSNLLSFVNLSTTICPRLYNIMKVILWLFTKILFGVKLITWNVFLYPIYESEIWT